MKNRVNQPETSLYFSVYSRAAAALLISLFLVLLSSPKPFFELIKMHSVYASTWLGFVIALILIELIHWVNVILDRFYPWPQWHWRLPLQLVFGTGPLLYLDWLLVKAMYLVTENDFEKSGFTEDILPVNLLLICTGHLIFYVRQRLMRNKAKPTTQVLKVPEPDPLYWATVEGSIQNKKYIFPLNAICCLVTASVYGDIYLKDGRRMNMNFRKTVLRSRLDPDRFVEISGGVFLAYDVIAEIKAQGKGGHIILNIDHQNDLPLSISRRFFPTFMAGFKAYQANKN